MPISLNGDGVISGVSTLTNPSEITVGTGASVFSPATNVLALGTNSAERVRIDSSGRTGIGTIPSDFSNNANSLELHSPNSTQTFLSLTNTTTGSNGANNGLNLAMIGSSARFLNRENGEIQFQINGTERLRILAAGGITFNGDTAATNALDDYEEGDFDPTVTMTSSGSFTLQSNFNSLSYTKIGSLVLISGQIRINTVSSPVGNIRITNLPFTVKSTTELGRAGGAIYYFDNSAGVGNYYKTVPLVVEESTTNMDIYIQHYAGGLVPAASDELGISLMYVAA